jgi:hypothetical protein
MSNGKSTKAKKGAGMSGRDSFTENRGKKEGLKKPSNYGGTKNNTYIRPQPD